MRWVMTQLVQRFLSDRRALTAELRAPFLLWTAAEGHLPSASWRTTEGGATGARPRPGETFVYPVQKTEGQPNAFSMGVTVGRVESNDIVLDDASVSRFHAWLQQDARTAEWFVVDAESRNGTWVNGVQLAPNGRVRLDDGSEVGFGDTLLRFWTTASLVRHLQSLLDARALTQPSKR